MADLEAAGQHLSFDDILEAVQESKRGRWFLNQYADRLRQQEAATFLAAINRLESRMVALAPQAATSPSAISAVQAALHNARQDLVKLGLAPQALSEEGRLFAQIAENARKSMPIAVDSNAQIVRTLELVSEIDQAVSSPQATRGADYFTADASLFERPTMPKPALVTKSEAQPVEPSAPVKSAVEASVDISKPAQGAKLVIRRSPAPATMDGLESAAAAAETLPIGSLPIEPLPIEPLHVEPLHVEPRDAPAEPVAAVAVSTPVPHAGSTASVAHVDTPRIVIIRRKAEDMPDIALPDQTGSAPSATAEEAHSAA